jgi:signal recognition particle subunit SRP54
VKEGLRKAIEQLIGSTSSEEEAVKTFLRDVQRTLLSGDVNVRQVFELTSAVEQRTLKGHLPPGISRREYAIKILYEEMVKILGRSPALNLNPHQFNIILLVGIQGSGKTTVAGKLARFFLKRGYKVGLICADTYRPGAYEQLTQLTSPFNIEVFWHEKGDPIDIVKNGMSYFKDRGRNLVIIDTAGRHKDEGGLMEEMEVISKTVNPTLTLLVIDSSIGQQARSQALAFHNTVPVGGLVITKLDGSAKGGGALAAAAATGAPVYFLCAGEHIDDIELFEPTRFISRLLGMGDLQTLLEKTREAMGEQIDADRIKKILAGKMTMDDLLREVERVRKMGPLKQFLEMIPGLSSTLKGEEADLLEERLHKWKSIIQSMTREERATPAILNSQRIKRIARGSGRSEKDVKELLQYFKRTQDLVRRNRSQLIKMMTKGQLR